MPLNNKQFTLEALIKNLAVTIKGDNQCKITGIAPIQQAKAGDITFLNNSHYRKYLATTKASAVILSKADADHCPITAVISHNPYYTYALIAKRFANEKPLIHGLHPTVIQGENCQIDPSATIAAHCVLGDRVKIAANVVIGPGTAIGDDCVIGKDSQIAANVTLYEAIIVGERANIASGVVIGADGFGFAPEAGKWHKIPQLGTVIIGNDVDIGANTTIDRGALGDTKIDDGVKLDNLIQIGHNVHIGAHTIIAGCVAIAGSTIIGKHCMIGGASCFAGHIEIADQVIITGMTAVTKSISTAGMYSSGIVGAVPNVEFRKNNARFHRLEQLTNRVKQLENALKAMTERQSHE